MIRSSKTESRHITLARAFCILLLLVSPCNLAHAQSSVHSSQAHPSSANSNQTVLNETDQYRLSPTVVKLGAMLGMDPETAANVFTIFNIAVLLAAVGYGLRKTLPKAFLKRNTDIQKHLVDARATSEEATARLNSLEERLSRLDDQIAAMKTQADADLVREEARMRESVSEEKAKILAAADAEIQNAARLARREIQKLAADLAIAQAAKDLKISTETDQMLITHFAQSLGERSKN